MLTKAKNTAIRTLFVKVIVSLCFTFVFTGLALSGIATRCQLSRRESS